MSTSSFAQRLRPLAIALAALLAGPTALAQSALLRSGLLGSAPSVEPSSAAPGKSEGLRAAAGAPSAADGATPERTLQSGSDVVSRARLASRALEQIRARAEIGPDLERLQREISAERDALAERVRRAREDLGRPRHAFEVRDIRFSFLADRKRIAAWDKWIGVRNERLAESRKQADALLEFWQRTQRLAEQNGAAPSIRELTDKVVASARETASALTRLEAVLIPLQASTVEMSETLSSLLEAADAEGPDLSRDAAQNDFTVVAAVEHLGEAVRLRAVLRTAQRGMLGTLRQFADGSKKELLAHALLTLLAIATLFGLRAQMRLSESEELQGHIARRIVGHPVAGGLQVSTLMSLFIYQEVPTSVLIILYLGAIGSALFLFFGLVPVRVRRPAYLIGAFVFLDLLRVLVAELVYVERVLLIAELAAFASVLTWALRKNTIERLGLSSAWTAAFRSVTWFWLVGACLATLAGLLGYGRLAEIVGSAMVRSLYLALISAGMAQALGSVVWVLTQTRAAETLHFVRGHRSLVVQRLALLLNWVALFYWARGTLNYLTLYAAFAQGWNDLMAFALEVGALHISLGSVVALVLGSGLAIYLARLIRFLLDQDLLGRLPMSLGSRQLAASGIFWVVALLGFFSTLAAAGIALDRLTVLAGALGVGLGFGLQNVVQNFAAGMILLFGRTIRVGDKIQLSNVIGEVTSIGFRASTVHTWQGAEVIVPNASLISDQVINWTLSDQKRRVELDIGVRYGTDPEQVLEILREAARSHPKVLAEPPVVALFLSHGDSSLNFQLRAWVVFDDFVTVASDLTVSLNKRLTAAGIEIPFPQRDLHVRSLAPEVADALGARGAGPEAGPAAVASASAAKSSRS